MGNIPSAPVEPYDRSAINPTHTNTRNVSIEATTGGSRWSTFDRKYPNGPLTQTGVRGVYTVRAGPIYAGHEQETGRPGRQKPSHDRPFAWPITTPRAGVWVVAGHRILHPDSHDRGSYMLAL
jgi:hypothetical protein